MREADLDALILADMTKAQGQLSEADLDQLILKDMLTQPVPDEPGFLATIGQGALEGAAKAGEFIDRFTGAPTRAALGGAITTEGGALSRAMGASEAFINQFGSDPSQAPTGKEIAQAAQLPEFNLIDDPAKDIDKALEDRGFKISKSPDVGLTSTGAAGLAVDILADWSNFIPITKVLQGAGKASKMGGKVTLLAIDTSTGTKIATKSADDVARAVDNVVASVKKTFKPTIASDFAEYTEIAKKNGIDPSILPETVEFGPSSTVTKKAKVIAEGPAGEMIQERFKKAKLEIENALDRKITEFGGGTKLSDSEAGQLLLDSYNNSVKKFFDQDFVTNQRIINENPGLTLTKDATKNIESKLRGMSNFATGRMKRGLKDQRTQAAAVLDAVETMRRSFTDGKMSYKNANEVLSNIGEEAFKKFKGDDPMGAIYRDKLKDLYFTMRESMNSTVAGKVSKKQATELANSNQIISDFLSDKGVVQKIMKSDVAPEKIAKALIENPDTQKIKALQNILGMSGDPAAINQFKGFVADKLIKKNAEGSPLYRTSMNNISKKRDIVEAIFSPKEVTELGEVLKLGDRAGDFILNTSATNTASRFNPANFLKEVTASVTDEVALERMKDIARGRITSASMTQKQAQEYLPLFTKKLDLYKVKEAGKLKGIQETNEELEKERRRRREAME